MNGVKSFKTICNETTTSPNGSFFTISSECGEDGEFEITVSGNGGVESARKAIKRINEAVLLTDL